MRRQISTNPPLPPPAHPSQPSPIAAAIWRACAGPSVQIPTVNSMVYYFIQGHLDQASSTPKKLSPNVYSTPFVLARIAQVQFFADHNTDEVFVKLVLHPINRSSVSQFVVGESSNGSGDGDENDVVSFSKILTPSDANNGGGFSVPRFCADSIFPPLNFQEDPPFQNLMMFDLHGNVWDYRHIYRGTPRRHLLTTGWSKFVNFKNLVAGDSVVFMKNSKGEIFAGIRRAKRSCPRGGGGGSGAEWHGMMLGGGGMRKRDEEGEKKKQEEKVVKEGFSRNGKGKLAPEKVAEAAELAVQGMPFEVVYYPSAGWSDFVLKAEIVDEAMKVRWSPGMGVKVSMEAEDSSRITSFPGTVSAVCVPENGQWRGSPWRMLQVAWDDSEPFQNAKLVSPWQVELVSATPALHAAFTSTKRFRPAHGSLVLTDGEEPLFPLTGYSNSTTGQLNRTSSGYGTFPAGMQGARHDFFPRHNFYNFSGDMSHLYLANSFVNNLAPSLNTLSTELNIGSSQSDNLSPDSQGSLHSFGIEIFGTHNCNSTTSGSGSIQLFGATIETRKPT
ncbi:unnamed protein product [Lupinus luteus]|uniref:Auxin response factor n=1 Tax=Lupinus luteus TaxID=3873 RepID=A0AAV1Y0A3_LUPLU